MATDQAGVVKLPWKNYEGESAQELVALKGQFRVDSLVCAFEEALMRKSEHSGPEHIVLAVEGLEREVNNGGFAQFFTNSTREYIPAIVDALTAINCPSAASIADKAIASLHLAEEITEEAIETALTEEVEENLNQYDDQFYKYPDPIAERLFNYIAAHINEIHLK